MEQKEIRLICQALFDEVNDRERKQYSPRYETFLGWFGMENRRSFDILAKVDYQLKKFGITVWAGNEQLRSVQDFLRGETITFRLKETKVGSNGLESSGNRTVGSKNSGTIHVSAEESGLTLYKHQEEAIENLNNKIIKTGRNPFAGLLVLPTGGGKTLTAAYWLCRNFLDQNKKILWIAHRHELLEQAKATFHERLAYKDVFQSKSSFNYRILSGIHDKPVHIKPTDDLIISAKDSLNAGIDYLFRNWIKDKSEEVFLVIDEAHHATAKTYRKLISNLQSRVDRFRMIGLTATPFRTAEVEQGLLGKVFPDDIVYKADLRTLISRGILSEPKFEEVATDIDMTGLLSEKELNNLSYFDIESIGKDTARTIAENKARNWCIVHRYVKHRSRYRQTLVFALNQDNAIALKRLFKEQGVKADYVLSSIRDQAMGVTISSKENKEKIDRFRKGELDVLINVNILTEGTDLPQVRTVFLARPTISPILMTQMIGRGLRGEKAGGTREAYIVSFIDDWKDKVAWVNPEKLLIEENVDFNDKDAETRKQLIRLVSISKIEEFAILTNKSIDITARQELEKLDFIERVPLGIYHFSILKPGGNPEESNEKNCEVLVYDNLKQSYEDFITALPRFFQKHKLTQRTDLTEEELESYCLEVEGDFFYGVERYPCYNKQDIKDILQYYTQVDEEPKYVALKDREKYDIAKVAHEILDRNLGRKEEEEYKSGLWESHITEWKAFFGYDKRYFLNEIDLAIRKLTNPELFKRSGVVPTDTKELRKLEELSMAGIREYNPQYWKWLSDKVYEKHKDADGYYRSAWSGYKSRQKLDFQIDHIVPLSRGGLTTMENLQLLTIQENAAKGAKEYAL